LSIAFYFILFYFPIVWLQGMAIVTEQNITTMRPLLHARKVELIEFLKWIGREWREDASNMLPKYHRNRVRNELVPLMMELAGTFP
jgi:tRNA(Ile)-lysidine synthase